jgi:uncharacterized Fe-S cluster-containing radical SAM superfamily enzyme
MSWDNLDDFKKYKQSKLIVKELTFVIKIINLTLKGLGPFKRYTSIKEIIRVLEEHKGILEVHLNSNKKTIDKKDEKG